MSNRSVVEFFGREETGHRCGYCKSPESSLADGMWAHFLTCQDYQDLLDRGWRRSGKYCYKPIMNQTCCPQYTIRLDAVNAKLRKSQKKVIKNFNKYIATGIRPVVKKKKENELEEGEEVTDERVKEPEPPKMDISFTGGLIKGADPSKPKCRKAKEIRKEIKSAKTEKMCNDMNKKKSSKNKEKTYEEWIDGIPSDAKVKFEVKLVRCCPEDENFTSTFNEELSIYRKYQIEIHKDEPEEVDERQFRRFLCEGPLLPVYADEYDGEIPSCGFGAFHQQYYLNGKIVAVGVLDILPNIVSSKYFFYDPDYRFLSFGIYSALREIYFIRSLHEECPSMRYYYMGYYVHSCTKMKYKGNFHPSYLLCPETFNWIPAEDCFAKLDVNKYSRLEDDINAVSTKYGPNDALVLYNRQAMPFQVFLSLLRRNSEKQDHLETVEEYTGLTGKACKSMLLFRS